MSADLADAGSVARGRGDSSGSPSRSRAQGDEGEQGLPDSFCPVPVPHRPVRPRRAADVVVSDAPPALWTILEHARRTSNKRCVPAPHTHFCVSQHHTGSRRIPCDEVFPDSRCRACSVREQVDSILYGGRWEKAVKFLQLRDEKKAPRCLSAEELEEGLAEPAEAMAGERVELSAEYVSHEPEIFLTTQLQGLPRVVPFVPKLPPAVTFRELKAQLQRALSGDDLLPPMCWTDHVLTMPPEVVRADVQRLLNLEDRLKACRESVDLVDQFYVNTRTGRPSPGPFHAHGHLELTPNWRNGGKDGGLSLTFDYMLVAVCLKQMRACSEEHLEQLESLLRFLEPLDVLSYEESVRYTRGSCRKPGPDDAAKAAIIGRIERAKACFGVGATETMGASELVLPPRPTAPDISLVVERLRGSEAGVSTEEIAAVATPARRRDLLTVLDQLE